MQKMKTLSYEDIRNLRIGKKGYDTFNFPFMPDVPISIRVLSQDDIIKASANWRYQAKQELKDPTNQDSMDFGARELLFQAVMKHNGEGEEPTERFFGSSKEVWELSMDEIVMLLQYYNEVQEKYTPLNEATTSEEMEELIEEVKKKSPRGMSLSTPTLRKLVFFMGETLGNWQKVSESTYSQLSKSEENTKSKPSTKAPIEKGIKLADKNSETQDSMKNLR